MIEDIKKTLWATADKLRANMDEAVAEFADAVALTNPVVAALSATDLCTLHEHHTLDGRRRGDPRCAASQRL